MTTSRNLAAACAAAALLAVAATAQAVDYPTLKSGQWEMTTSGTGSAPDAAARKSSICLDAATQKTMIEMGAGMQKEMCTRMDMKREGAQFITDAECKLGNSVVKSRGVMTMIGDSAYRTETTATFDPPLGNNMRESKTVIEGKYLGACKDGMKPGDMLMGNGQKINVNQLQQPPASPPSGAPKAK
jgi:hypothetical protein